MSGSPNSSGSSNPEDGKPSFPDESSSWWSYLDPSKWLRVENRPYQAPDRKPGETFGNCALGTTYNVFTALGLLISLPFARKQKSFLPMIVYGFLGTTTDVYIGFMMCRDLNLKYNKREQMRIKKSFEEFGPELTWIREDQRLILEEIDREKAKAESTAA